MTRKTFILPLILFTTSLVLTPQVVFGGCTCYTEDSEPVPYDDYCEIACGEDPTALESDASTGTCTCADGTEMTNSCDYVCELNGLSTEDTKTIVDDGSSSSTSTQSNTSKLITPVLSIDIPTVKFSDATVDGVTIKINYLGDYIAGVYKWLLGSATLIAIVMLMIGGLQYTIFQEDKAKTRIKNAVTGLVLLLSTYLILVTINPQLVLLNGLEIENIAAIALPSTEDTAADVAGQKLPDCPTAGTNGVPYFCQRNYSDPYGVSCENSRTIATSGCGPTSLAMVLSFYKVSADPKTVAASFESGGYRVCGSGTAAGAFQSSKIVTDNNMQGDLVWAAAKTGDIIPESERTVILSHLSSNEPIIISVGPSRFTGGGHFMVLTGVNADGTISLNDPNSGYNSTTQDELWSILKYALYVRPKS